MKFSLPIEELIAINESPGTRAYSTPFAPGKVVIGSLAWGRGEVPEKLKSYVGQTAEVAKACKGRKGYAFVVCLREKAKELGITKGITKRKKKK